MSPLWFHWLTAGRYEVSYLDRIIAFSEFTAVTVLLIFIYGAYFWIKEKLK